MSRRARCVGFAILLPVLAPTPGLQPAPDRPSPPLTAVVTALEGVVTTDTAAGDIVRVLPRQVIPDGSVVNVSEPGAASLVCSTDHLLRLGGGTALRLSSETCATGLPLAPGTYAALSPSDRTLDTDRYTQSVLRRLDRTRTTIVRIRTRGREEQDPGIPVLLEPRDSGTLEPRPVLRWTRVPRAREIAIKVVGPAPWTAKVPVSDVDCAERAYPPGSLEVCSLPWPQDAPDLPADGQSYLAVGVKTTIGGAFSWGDRHRVWRVPDARARAIQASLEVLEQAEAPSSDADLRVPLFLADQGLLDAAGEALQEELTARPSATGLLLQGALELERSLPLSAARSFREAERAAKTPEVATAAGGALRTALALTESDH